MKHPSDEQFVLYHYGEGEEASRREVEQHLASCEACRASYRGLEGMLAAVDALPVPERPATYEAEVWQRLRRQLPAPSRLRWFTGLPPRRWALAGTMAALLVAAFLAGRYWQQGQAPGAAAIPAQARERILLIAVGDHLDRSGMLLIELVHAEGPDSVNIARERQRAQELVASNRIYRQTALRAGETGLANVLDDLERVLLQIAHSPSSLSPAQLQEIDRRIEARGVLFKVRVISSQVREKEKASARELARRIL